MYKIANQAWKDTYGPFHFLLLIYDTTLCHTCHAILKNVLLQEDIHCCLPENFC